MSSVRHSLALLTIDLAAVATNYRLLRAHHATGAVAAVVKADGYGLGAIQVARKLRAEGCGHFFVATLDEALALAPSVPDSFVSTLTGIAPNAVRDQAASGIVPVLNSVEEIALWRAEAARLDRALPACLHVDTGMNRLGMPPAEVDLLAADHSLCDGIDLRFIMTHLVSAERAHDPENPRQLARFRAATLRLPPAPRSIANSAGVFLGADFQSDLARPGSALYGVNPRPGAENPMRAVVTLEAPVLQIRDIEAGETVGYNGLWQAPRPSRIATVGVGYADGWLRALSNRGAAFFDGTPLPLVGRVSMDLITFDATAAPGLKTGDRLELIGVHQDVGEVATAADTSAYEILTSLGSRYARLWLGD